MSDGVGAGCAATPASAPPGSIVLPRLAREVELLGPYRDSGLQDPPYLIRRGAALLQVSQLLLVVAAAANGHRGLDEIAAVSTGQLGRRLSADDVRYLVEEQLAPAGIVTLAEDADRPPPPPAEDHRVLALRFRKALLLPEVVDDVARLLGILFRRPIVIAVLAFVVVFDAWLFGVHGVNDALEQVVRQSGLLPFLLALTCLSAAFHEFGHAAACRYSGARPGVIGGGVYLIWPVLYTNVTDTYRLGRAGRLRTDLGGIYFNAVFIVALAGAYAATGYEPLVAAVVVQHLLILDQLMPWARFDGYYVVSDLTGVPDILDRVRPALRSIVPGRPPDPEIIALRPKARRLLFCYLASMVVFVVFGLVTLFTQGPGLVAAAWHSLPTHLEALENAVGMWDLPVGILVVIQIGMIVAPAVGMVLMLGFLGSRLTRTARLRWG